MSIPQETYMDLRAYLRQQRLFTDDPYNQECLREKEKIINKPASVTFDNFYRSPKEKIFCHICGSHRHFNGITGLLGDRTRILFGSSCAKEFFGQEVMRLCAGDLKARTKKASDRYLIMEVISSIEPVEQWLSSYRSILSHIERAWVEIHIKYEQPVVNLLTHLKRYNGRLLDTTVISFGGVAGKQQDFEYHNMLAHVSATEAIPYLKQVSQRADLIDAFIHAVKTVRSEPNEQMFSNLAALYQKTMDAAKDVDACLAFTSDFFREEKLALISNWIEKQRRLRLPDTREVTQQNLGHKFRKIMGSGVEKPSTSLSDAIRSTNITEKLKQRGSSKEHRKSSGA